MAVQPAFDFNYLDPFPDAYCDYFNDGFSLRNQYLLIHNYLKYYSSGPNIDIGNIHIGIDGWFFRNGKLMPREWKRNLFTSEELERAKKEIEYRHNYLSERNCDLYIFIIPSKQSIYPEKVHGENDSVIKKYSPDRVEQFTEYFSRFPHLNVINLKPYLLNCKREHDIYFKHDTHWNSLGGFYASKKIMDCIREDHPEIPDNLDLNNFIINWETRKGGDLASNLGISDLMFEPSPGFKPVENLVKLEEDTKGNYPIPENFAYSWGYEVAKTTHNPLLPNALIIRDSYGDYIIPFLSRGFNRTLFIWDKWEYGLNESIVGKEKPDIFILTISEYFLDKLTGAKNENTNDAS